VKYSSAGSEVRVEVKRVEGEVRCKVIDHGIGVPEVDRAHLFDRYYRASNSGETRAKGLGLGLYVSHAIVGRHGGRMWIESTAAGQGSTFVFSLPSLRVERTDDVDEAQGVSSSSTALPSGARPSTGA
jgi:signal transduction histidine kinase